MAEQDVQIETFAVGPLGCNCSIIADPVSREGLLVDPGWDAESILERIAALDVRIVAAIHTHAHIDHINGTLGVHEELEIPAELHEEDLFLYRGVEQQALMLAAWGLPCEANRPPEPARLLEHGDCVGHASFEMEVIHTPGHTPGSLSFLLQKGVRPVLFSGDTLFQNGVGRTDLEGGDTLALKRSIRERIFALEDDTIVVPGHGPGTTVGHERSFNPFVRA